MKPMLRALLLLFALALFAAPAAAQRGQRAYAPEDLRGLSYNDQVRVISLEYEEQSRGRRIPDDQLRFYIDQVNRSNWRFSQIKSDIARSLGGQAGGGYPGPGNGGGGIVRCESNDNRGRTCPTPWRGSSRLIRQVSGSPCIEGQTWQNRDGAVFVVGGCRGDFGPGFGGGNGGIGSRQVRCESNNNRYVTCPAGGRVRDARLVRQLSGTPCTEGQTWGTTRDAVWVNGGCRAIFEVDGRGGGGNGDPNYSVTCASNNNRYTTCAWNAAYGRPRLIQQMSGSPCVQDSTWGYTRGQLWVSGGCRGRFGTR
ncbi:DUF3011 domain-containing protein [Tolypothrix campylonemoides VB511288]|nr:DUF3011 domain-containing protein [Tolypothrix campylonemoides VB511288]